MSMEIKKGFPPNYAQICAAIPQARMNGVIFAYGDTIYVPSGNPLPHALKVHEAVHGIRQTNLGVDFWWEKYLTDTTFRYYEELLAHAAEYKALCVGVESAKQKKKFLKQVAARLASPLYGANGGWEKVSKDILHPEKYADKLAKELKAKEPAPPVQKFRKIDKAIFKAATTGQTRTPDDVPHGAIPNGGFTGH